MSSIDPIRRLKEIARDIQQVPIQNVPREMEKVFFICINTYKGFQINTGSSPMMDAFNLARIIKHRGYQVFFIHNPHAAIFMQYFAAMLESVYKHLIFMYIGRGTGVQDLDGDELDGVDEALVFDDGVIIDDDLVTCLVRYKNQESRLTLLTDASYKDTIWDMEEKSKNGKPIPPNVLSLSAETRLQTMTATIEAEARVEKGAFAQALTTAFRQNAEATPDDLQRMMENTLREAGQVYTVGTTSPELLSQPVLI
ncbi:Clan CD, family C14, metacaspase-like cysteine peptidase [Tritrichomonas foetus]|uniref:Clan CD, family C14, metacaspase-like cysteine peptidase n=1 Tax=Tritrichomonas foetus TaxID=1144522 RepID=A0A1J4JZ39_9EUKA|nr:Clan CD, family C14, metacaspase-like cysteine peptidase [Tritrichomonas foetus]|eukprot:OHT02525.1 Clan CD, family C14, metacaspase-like cysteine peptidase [Tritrichomonas foetus]